MGKKDNNQQQSDQISLDNLMNNADQKKNQVKKRTFKKKIITYSFYFLLFMGFIWGWVYYFLKYHNEQAMIKDKMIKIKSLQDEVTSLVFSWEEQTVMSWNKQHDDKLIQSISNLEINYDWKEILDKMDIDMWDETMVELQNAYSEAIVWWDERLQLELLERIYSMSSDEKLEYLIFNKSLNLYDFERALKFMKLIQKRDKELNEWDTNIFIYVMINALDLTPKNIEEIKNIVKLYYKRWDITQDDYYYYNLMIYLSKADFSNFKNNLDMLSWSAYDWFYKDMMLSYKEYDKYKDASEYFLQGLLSFVVFQHWFFNIAERMSQEILKTNSWYLLPNQIMAYSNFVRNKFDVSQIYLKKLIEYDSFNQDTYKLFLWISYFWNKNYNDSIVYLSQIKTWNNMRDVYRYLFLSYYNIGDYKNMSKYMWELVNLKWLTEYDYYTFFDLMFYKDFEKWTKFELYEMNQSLAIKYLTRCQREMWEKESFICKYGVAWYDIAKWNEDSALKYLLYLVQYYPRSYMFDRIWDLYSKQWKIDLAKSYYVKSIYHTYDSDQKSKIKNKLFDLILKN